MEVLVSTGCYGLEVRGLPGAAHLLRQVRPQDPPIEVSRRVGPSDVERNELSDSTARYRLGSGAGSAVLDRASMTAAFTLDTGHPDGSVVHPFLALASTVFARWCGREALHAGAVEIAGRAWGLLGVREAGKSSLVAQAHLLGLPVVTDDVLVVDDGTALPGPGLVDLRAGAAAHLGLGEALGVVGRRERWRVPVPATGPVPLAGWVLPSWGATAISSIPVRERLGVLRENIALGVPPTDPAHFFELGTLPMVRFSRPRDWTQLAASTGLLLEHLRSLGS
ncbi:protein of unknown function [Modestobacter italicus]|uniref:Hpr(Ser) kinase/phosphatase n=1 Tax=Modestobacter italicus (strain DSM 44449 / CECT 9708 / BC 501) TaxID=2732864 RepID=I4ERB0_MODI5|nr:hypothetical protein [Modestobacter marinus]CCH85923.1 protein of unknown function [Modestobacter marinus]